jgi:uncharacterized protein (TIGR00369 family)
MLEREWLGKTLGIEFSEATPERVVAIMPITPAHHQPFGYLHGGASVALAETVASVGGMLNVPPGKVVFGQVIDANHVRPRQSGTLRAIGTPLHVGKSSQIWDIRILDEDDKLVCVSRCTLAVVSADGAS